ncbi:uncharacterized protein [Chaetodon trifascialis]|uniref:uncharacterized protein n=1 Tax=Chaetodon trifascialis TaxID=109706 RepID=UPI003995D4B0
MTSPVFSFCLACLFLGKMAQSTHQTFSSSHHESSFVSANVGENLTLECFYEHDEDSTRIYWYKQNLGHKLRLISTRYVFNKYATFHDEFQNNSHFTLHAETGKNHLTITDMRTSDSASYYCARRFPSAVEFTAGTVVSVKASGVNIPALVHQSTPETIQPGRSVTLNCTVHTETCDEEHSVYWFKSSEESHPGLIYTHGCRNDQSEKKPNTQTHTCVYNLPMKSLNLAHVGTYYCAVASCGHIVFGERTKLDFEDEVDSLVMVYFLSTALTFTIILLILLAVLIYVINKRNNCKCAESQARFSAPSTANAEGYRDTDNLHYAALSVNLPKTSRRQRNNADNECVNSRVKQ